MTSSYGAVIVAKSAATIMQAVNSWNTSPVVGVAIGLYDKIKKIGIFTDHQQQRLHDNSIARWNISDYTDYGISDPAYELWTSVAYNFYKETHYVSWMWQHRKSCSEYDGLPGRRARTARIMTTGYKVFNKVLAQQALTEDPDNPDDIMAFETMMAAWYDELDQIHPESEEE
jgi:hypothetical protein